MINGKDIKKYTDKSVINNISFAQQGTALFTATLRDNLTMGHKNITDQQLHKSLASANYINKTTDNVLDYMINAKGTNLSGGRAEELSQLISHNNPGDIIDEPKSD